MEGAVGHGREVSLARLQHEVKEFGAARGWLRFHNPRSVAEAIVVEAAELLECFQWRTDDACLADNLDQTTRHAVESELADVVIYALTMANVLGIDASDIIRAKLQENAIRFPPSTGS